jgi:hypothetical protein
MMPESESFVQSVIPVLGNKKLPLHAMFHTTFSATGFHSLRGGNSRLGDAMLLQIGDVEND